MEVQSKEAKILFAFERIATVWKFNLQQVAKANSVTSLQLQILFFLRDHRDPLCNTSDIAKEFGVTKPTVSDSIKALLNKELVSKHPLPSDGRAFTFKLTEKGSRLAHSENTSLTHASELLDGITIDTLDNLWEILLSLMQNLSSADVIPLRMCHACAFYSSDKDTSNAYCQFLQMPLRNDDLRLDCPDFEPQTQS